MCESTDVRTVAWPETVIFEAPGLPLAIACRVEAPPSVGVSIALSLAAFIPVTIPPVRLVSPTPNQVGGQQLKSISARGAMAHGGLARYPFAAPDGLACPK